MEYGKRLEEERNWAPIWRQIFEEEQNAGTFDSWDLDEDSITCESLVVAYSWWILFVVRWQLSARYYETEPRPKAVAVLNAQSEEGLLHICCIPSAHFTASHLTSASSLRNSYGSTKSSRSSSQPLLMREKQHMVLPRRTVFQPGVNPPSLRIAKSPVRMTR